MPDDQRMNMLMWEAVKVSIKAGKAILDIYGSDFSVSSKADKSPLTRADMASHALITQALINTGLPILSEEGREIPWSKRSSWNAFWLVDPLDGTKEFVNRNGDFTVNIAYIEGGFPCAGVIYIPVTDELYLGMGVAGAFKFSGAEKLLERSSGMGSFLGSGQRLQSEHGKRSYTVVGSRSHMNSETEAFILELRKSHGHIDFMSRGSSLKICMVAEGRADIYPRFAPTMEWDTAAGQAVAEAAGAVVVDATTGERLRYNKPELLNPWFIVRHAGK